MPLASSIKSIISSADIIGLDIGLRHHHKAHYNTIPGGILTILTTIFIIYCVFYFGEDIYHKKKPISRFNKILSPKQIFLKDYPIPISFISRSMPLLNVERYFDITADMLLMDYTPLNLTAINKYSLIVERCTKEHVAAYGDLFVKDSFFPFSYCMNPNKLMNGTEVQQGNPFIQGEMTSFNSSALYYTIAPCVNSTANGNRCAPQSEITTVLSDCHLSYPYVDAYVNLDSYETPYNYFLNRNVITLNSKLGKTNFVKVKSTAIQTDSGFIMDDLDERSLLQAEPPTTDTLGDASILISVFIFTTKIQDTYVRKYVKVQDIVANVGGLLKFLLTLGTIVLMPYQQRSFKFEIINSLYKISESVEGSKGRKVDLGDSNQPVDVSKGQKIDFADISQKPIDITKNNYVSRIGLNSSSFKDINLSFRDYAKALLGCTNKYSKKQYNHLIDFVNRKFEFMTYVKTTNTVDYLVDRLMDSSHTHRIMDKNLLRWASDGVVSHSLLDEII
jgi:hypothetical protein